MQKRIVFGWVTLIIPLFLLLSFFTSQALGKIGNEELLKANAVENSSSTGFLENKGQLADQNGKPVPEVLFETNLSGVDVFVTEKGLTYLFKEIEKLEEEANTNSEEGFFEEREEEENHLIHWQRVDMQLKGASMVKANIKKEKPTQGYNNYYLAHCPDGILNVKSYGKVTIEEIYPGIDWVLYADEKGAIKYDFVVHPGADPSQIEMEYKGGANFQLQKEAENLLIETQYGGLLEGELYCYTQESKEEVKASYEIKEKTVKVLVNDYNKEETLIIDPPLQLRWGTCYGQSEENGSRDMAVSLQRDLYIVGYTNSSLFPTQDPGAGAYFQGSFGGGLWDGDAFILKFDENGQRKWATYYGGEGDEAAVGVSIGQNNELVVAGETKSVNFPVYDPGGGAFFQESIAWDAFVDAFILKFDDNGQRTWATYYGGSGNDLAYDVAFNANNDFFVVGKTVSNNFPVLDSGGDAYFQEFQGGGFDGFILKFDENSQRKWATYYGGEDHESATGISVNNYNEVFVTGNTRSEDFPVLDPGGEAYFQESFMGGTTYDAYILKFDENGKRAWATYYGGTEDDLAMGITTNADSAVFVVGGSTSNDFPVFDPGWGFHFQETNAGLRDVFVLEFNNMGVRKWATYYGGENYELARAVSVNRNNEIFVAGETSSIDFPLHDPCEGSYFQEANAGSWDSFILQFNEQSERKWATYYGGQGNDWATSVASTDSCFWVAGEITGMSLQPYTLNPGNGAYYQPEKGGGVDADNLFILQFCESLFQEPAVDLSSDTSICLGDSVVLVASGGESYLWENGSTDSMLTVYPLTSDNYWVEIFTSSRCSIIDSVEVAVDPLPVVSILGDTEICEGDSTVLAASGGDDYLWQTGEHTSNITVFPQQSGYYVVEVFENQCSSVDSIYVDLQANPMVSITGDSVLCQGSVTMLSGNGADSYDWGDGLNSNPLVISPTMDTLIQLYGFIDNCVGSDSLWITVLETPDISANFGITPNPGKLGEQIYFVDSTQGNANSWYWDFGDGNTSTERLPVHIYDSPGRFAVRLFVNNESTCRDSLTKLLLIENERTLLLPNTFTPNDDGSNDSFLPISGDLTSYRISIYTRSGIRVFSGDHSEPFRGISDYGKELPAGAYFYIVEFEDFSGESEKKAGAVTLLR